MFSSMPGWIMIGIIAFVILVVGGVALPMIVPMMTGYTQSSQDVIVTGTPFFQLMVDWWPVTLPLIIIIALVVLVMAGRPGSGGGSV